MIEAFIVLCMAVLACAAWQFIPAFRTLVKAVLIIVGAALGLGALVYFGYLAGHGNAFAAKVFDGAVGGAIGGLGWGLLFALVGGVWHVLSKPRWRNGVRVR